MINTEQESEELSATERRLLADFVVPAPSKAAEDQLMHRVQLQRQAQAPDELARRRWMRPVAIAACIAAAAGLLWMIDVERPGSTFSREAARPEADAHSAERPTELPGAARPETGWVVWGSAPGAYTSEVDPEMQRNGHATRALRSTRPIVGFGMWWRKIDAQPYVGKRVRLSAFVRSESVENWAGLLMRVDSAEGQTAFDNMESRAITGTTDWKKYEVVLDVADGASNIRYGILLNKAGTVWIDEIKLEVISEKESVTGVVSTEHDADGWMLRGTAPHEYETGLAPQRKRGMRASRFLRSSTADLHEYGAWETKTDATPYRGKRVRLSAWVRADAVEGWAGLWMRVDPVKVRTFDNMSDRPIKGTSGWELYEVVLDVSQDATHIAYGLMLQSTGNLWLDDVQLEVVSGQVPVTVGPKPTSPTN